MGGRRVVRSRDRVLPDAAGWCAAAVAVVVIYVAVASGGNLLLGRGATPTLGSSVVATVLVAISAHTVRVRVAAAVARRLPSGRPTPYELLSTFGRDLAESELDAPPAVIARMLAVGTGVARAEVWVLVEDRLTLVASHPAEAARDEPPPELYRDRSADGLRAVTVTHGQRPLGVLRVRERAGRPLTSVEESLLSGLAAQAGMVLQRTQLRAELAARRDALVEREVQLRRARTELVARQDRERRRLERDIHDGAQQQLVALAINLKLARALAPGSPDAAVEVLEEQLGATAEAIGTLTNLAGGLLPETLAGRGLVAALTEATGRNPVPVTVSATRVPRQPPAVEATLYFCVLEAVQNATKHAGASHVHVALERSGQQVTVAVTDDGRGLPDEVVEGAGLANLRERTAALGGWIQVARRAEGGTSVTVGVPVVAQPGEA